MGGVYRCVVNVNICVVILSICIQNILFPMENKKQVSMTQSPVFERK